VRYSLGDIDFLEPYQEIVNRRFQGWLKDQKQAGRIFSKEQEQWLTMIKDHIATSLRIEMDDFENVPFQEKGGAYKAYQIFGDDFNKILTDMNEVLVA